MSSAARILALVLCASVLPVALVGCARKVELMTAIPEAEANEVVGALQNAGISAEKVPGKEGMVGVSIPADKVGTAVDLLRDKGLPRERFAGMGQVFKKEGLISSPTEERARYLFALSQELSATLSQIDGVVVARVHVVLPERSAAGDATVPSSAAVFIKHHEGYSLDTVLPLVRRLVVNSIPGLTPEKVTIVMFSAQSNSTADRVQPTLSAGRGSVEGSVVAALAGVLAGGLALAALGAAAWLAWRKGWVQQWKAARAGTGG